MRRHAVSSKVQGTVKVRKFKKVRNLNSTPISIFNPGGAHAGDPGAAARRRHPAAGPAGWRPRRARHLPGVMREEQQVAESGRQAKAARSCAR